MSQPTALILSQDTIGTGLQGEAFKGGSFVDAGGGKANKVRIVNAAPQTDPITGNTDVKLLWVPHSGLGAKLDVNAEPSLTQVGPHEWTFEPTALQWGKWRVRGREVVNGANVDEVRIFGIPSPALGLFEPAFNEDADPNASLLQGGAPQIADSEDNEGGTFNGWQKDFRRLVEEMETLVVGPGDDRDVDQFVSGGGQTAFALSFVPNSPGDVMMYVNGIAYRNTTDFSVAGSTLTWLDNVFVLEAGDGVLVDYMN